MKRALAWICLFEAAACAASPSPTSPPHEEAVIAQKGAPVIPRWVDASVDSDRCSRSDAQSSAFLDQMRTMNDRLRALDAAERYVDRLQRVAIGGDRPACYAEMQRNVRAVISARCATRDPNDSADHECDLLERIDFQIERGFAEHDANEAADANDSELARHAGDRLFALARARCAGSTPMPYCDEVVFNTALIYLRAGDRQRADAARAFFRDPENRFADSGLGAKLDCLFDPSDAAVCR